MRSSRFHLSTLVLPSLLLCKSVPELTIPVGESNSLSLHAQHPPPYCSLACSPTQSDKGDSGNLLDAAIWGPMFETTYPDF